MNQSNELALLNLSKYQINQFFSRLSILLILILIFIIIDVLRPNGYLASKNLKDWQFIALSAIFFAGPIIFVKTVIFTELNDFKIGKVKITDNGISVKKKKGDDFFAKSEIGKAKIKRKRYLWGKNEIWKVKFTHNNSIKKHALIMPMGKIRSTFDTIQNFNN